MNNISLTGRMARDPEVRYGGGNQTAVARFSLAVNRNFKKDGEPDADFFNCVCFGKKAEFVEKYFHKGSGIAVVGELRNNNYKNKEGQMVYTNEIYVSNVEFNGSKQDNNAQASAPQTAAPTQASAPQTQSAPAPTMAASSDGFMTIPDGIEEELPFH